MNLKLRTTIAALAMLASANAQEADPAIAGLEKASSDFVKAYNDKKAADIAALFTEDAEISDLKGEDRTTGRPAIQARYEEIFADDNPPQMALEVASVRLVAPNLAIEYGTFHLTPRGDENEPPRSTTYTAVLLKNEAGIWQIASTRDVSDVTDAAGQLADLADVLKGEWTSRTSKGIQMDLAFGWDDSGKFLTGEILTTTPDAAPQTATMRIGWNAARKSIVSWIFDSEGGALQAVWADSDDGWTVRTEGTTAEGETMTANQELTTDGKDMLIWKITNKVIDGEQQPDNTLRFVRRPPEPEDKDDKAK